MYWMGIDVGTGGSRAVLINERGGVEAVADAPHEEMRMERPFWAEQRPENWWEASRNAVCSVLAKARATGHDVGGIGLSGQMHGLVMLDRSHNVIRPALIWCDQRSQDQVDWINQKIGKEKILARIANPVLTGFTLPKLLWIRDHEPSHFERIQKILLPKDYIRLKLTAQYATDVSDASGTALFDVAQRCWSARMVKDTGLDRLILPCTYESTDITGFITEEAAAKTGLKTGTPVVAGGGDQAASAVGNGIVEPGLVSCTLGTSGVIFAHNEQPCFDPLGRVHTFCHAVPRKWHVMGVTQGAGLSLQWLRSRLAPDASYDQLTAEAATAPVGAQGLFWLPYLMGERTPHLDANARAGWIGLTAKHTRADMIRAVIEGVSYSQKDGLDIIREMGVPVDGIRLSGGGAKSPFWRQILADVFATPVATLSIQEGSAYGAALLALAGTSANGNVTEICRTAIKEVARLNPRADESRFYESGHQIYRALYTALRDLYGPMQNLALQQAADEND